MSEEKKLTLTEWDFDIPRDNRFHDPFRWQDKNVKSSGSSSADTKQTQSAPSKEK